jgi:hypothetical protein
MLAGGHFHAAKPTDMLTDSLVIGRDNDISQLSGLAALVNDSFNKGFTPHISQRFAWESTGLVAGWNHPEYLHEEQVSHAIG